MPAILEAWFGGTQGGHAIADALFGDVNPGGKLPVTFPRVVGQIPLYYNHLNTGRPATERKYTSKYIDAPVTPLFPFGHGLSYTRFRLKDLRLDARRIPPDGRLAVSVDVENVGDRRRRRGRPALHPRRGRERGAARERATRVRAGHAPAGRDADRPVHAHAGRPRILRPRMHFVVEPGAFKVFVGTSSVGGLEADFEVVGSRAGGVLSWCVQGDAGLSR